MAGTGSRGFREALTQDSSDYMRASTRAFFELRYTDEEITWENAANAKGHDDGSRL
jgi:hypothetical protein